MREEGGGSLSNSDMAWMRNANVEACRPRYSRLGVAVEPELRDAGRGAVTLIELLCVITIIGILASLLLPAVLRAYLRAKEFDEDMEGGAIIEMIRSESRSYCVGHPAFQFSDKDDFVKKCEFAPKPSQWVLGSRSDFVPFGYLDPTNKIVLSLHYGHKQANYHAFTRGELSLPRE